MEFRAHRKSWESAESPHEVCVSRGRPRMTGVIRPATLRIGVAVGAILAPAWWDAVLRALMAAPGVELAGYQVASTPLSKAHGGATAWMLRAYQWSDKRVFGRQGDPEDLCDLSASLSSVDRFKIPHGPGMFDVLILLGVPPPLVASHHRPTFGWWSFQHDADSLAMAAPLGGALPPGGRELIAGRPSTTTRLVATVGPKMDRRLLGQVVSRVDRLSMRRGSRGHLQKLPALLTGALRDLQMDSSLPDVPAMGSLPSPGANLDAADVAIGVARAVTGFARRRLVRAAMPAGWVVGVSRSAGRGTGASLDVPDIRILQAPRGREWADPFPVVAGGRELVFVEEVVRSLRRGRIALVELDESQRGWRSVETILESPSHLSYPFVFEWDSAWYMMPEQASTGSLELYRAESFPRIWRWHSTALAGIKASDPTLVEIGGRWWLFTAVARPGGNAADELHIFHSLSPLGPWTAHGRNPVVSDVRTARPAGRIYRQDGRWFRPAQNGEVSYGHSIELLEIEELDVGRYRERPVAAVEPTWATGLLATHTLNIDANVAALDGLVRRSRLLRRQTLRPRLGRLKLDDGHGS